MNSEDNGNPEIKADLPNVAQQVRYTGIQIELGSGIQTELALEPRSLPRTSYVTCKAQCKMKT